MVPDRLTDSLVGWGERHPRFRLALSLLACAGWIAWETARVVQARSVLGANTWSHAIVVGWIAATVSLAAVVAVRRYVRGPAAIIGFLPLIIPFALTHPQNGDDHLRSFPAVAFVVGMNALGLLAFTGALITQPRRRRARLARRQEAEGTACAGPAQIWRVSDSEARKPTFEPFYVAHCACDWAGPAREGGQAESLARSDALEHTDNVTTEVLAPLG